MTWSDASSWLMGHVDTIIKTLGLGGGVGILKLVRHWPAPKVVNVWGGAVFDAFQDLTANNDRVGERIGPDGKSVFLVTKNPEKEQGK